MVDTTKPDTAPTFTVRDGTLTTTFDALSKDRATYVVLQQDGKILLGGTSDYKVALARYNTDGSLDTSFSGDGKLTMAVAPDTYIQSVKIVPQLDGKILAASVSSLGYTVTRYLSNGDLDTTFGTGGTLTKSLPVGAGATFASDIVVQADGKILVAGRAVVNAQMDFAVERYNVDGSSDTTFGANGRAFADIGVNDSLYGIVVQADGKILLNGAVSYSQDNVYGIARLNANGTLDTSFSGAGTLSQTFTGGSLYLNGAMAVQTDGKVVIGGGTYTNANGNSGMMLMRYTADGGVDTSFNGKGSVTLRVEDGAPPNIHAILAQKDGKILAAGNISSDKQAAHIVVMRFLADGSLDQTFGTKGFADAPIARDGGSYILPKQLLIQSDGKILVLGADDKADGDFALVRYNADGSLDQTFSPPANTLNGKAAFIEPLYDFLLAPVVLDSDVQVFDAELSAIGSYPGASLTLKRHEGANTEDVFSAKTGGTMSELTAGSYLAVDGVTIGRVTANDAGTLTLTFSGNATQGLVNKAMQQIAYANKSDAPPSQVQIDWTFSDGNTGAQGTGGALKATGSSFVTITGTNDAPMFNHAIPEQKLAAGVAFNYVIPADSFFDPDHDTLSYSITMSDGSGLPPWLVFDAATRTLSGTPDGLDTGTLAIRVTGKDGAGLSTSSVFDLTIETSSNVINGTSGADKLVGTAANDIIQGFAGSDTLDGKAGADTMAGGDGNDVYYIDNAGDTVSEAASGGTDTVYTTVASYQLASNVEYGRILATGASNLTGNELANVLYAGDGDNVLDGGLGNDTASYAYATSGVTVSLTTAQAQDTEGSGIDSLRNIENLAGSRFDDNLTGNQENNTLNGSTGADFMVGGNGSDIYIVDNTGDVVRETNTDPVKGGIDTVNSSVSFTLGANVENLTLTGTDAINATGNSLANKLVGNSGNNMLDGGAGADVMQGGQGNDAYYVDNSGDVVAEAAGAGTDTVITTVTRTLGDNQENLTLAGTAAINGTGNSLDNTITGNAARNVLIGGAGADKMYGGLGDDFYYVDNAGDTVAESSDTVSGGTDTVNATVSYTLGNYVENLTLSGSAAINGTGNALANKIIGNGAANVLSGGDGADTLVGGLGSDTLVGGQGKDVLEGGGGSDVFVFNATSESGTTSAAWDVVNDFVRGQDKVDLRGIDANTATVANDAFITFIAGTAAFTAAGQLKFLNGVLYGNTDGDADAEFAIQLTGIAQLTTADVVL